MNRSLPTIVAHAVTALAVATALAACGGSGGDTGARASAHPKTSAVAADKAQATYATKHFIPPLDVSVPAWLDTTSAEDTAHFVTFASSDESRAVRFLSPVVIYPPGSSKTATVPKDYVSYLLRQTKHGATFTGRDETTVGGHRATVVTGRTDRSIDGSLGCQDTGISAEDCYGLQPEFILRVAVVSLDQGPLLIWLRENVDDKPDMTAEAGRFAEFLSGVRFSDRTVQAEPVHAVTPLDGSYRWALSKHDALTHGTPDDKTAESLATYPWAFTITLASGAWHLHGEFGEGPAEDDTGTYEATADHLEIRWAGSPSTLSYDVSRDEAGNLQLTALTTGTPEAAGDRYVWTTKPWKRL